MIETNAGEIADRLQDQFGAVEESTQKELEQATIEAARIARRLAPVDTGELRDSIETDLTRHSIEATAEHAIYVEEGTINMAPQPFLRPAAEQAFADAARRLRGGSRRQ